MKVKCIKDYEYKQITVDDFASVPKGETFESISNGVTEHIYDLHDDYIISLDDDNFDEYFEIIDDDAGGNLFNDNKPTPPYVRCYFYPNGDENEGFIKKVEGWLDNDFPSNLAILTRDGCLCKFKFNNIEQMYPIKEPNDITYNQINKWHL